MLKSIQSFGNEVIPLQTLYEIYDPKSVIDAHQDPNGFLIVSSIESKASPLCAYDNFGPLQQTETEVPDSKKYFPEPFPFQPAQSSGNAARTSSGERVEVRSEWEYGEHEIDPLLWDKGGYEVQDVFRYSSEEFPRTFEVTRENRTNTITPKEDAVIWVKHEWIVVKATDPNTNETIWVGSWKDTNGNIHAQEFDSLPAANHTAFNGGCSNKYDGKQVDAAPGNRITLGSLIAYLRSIQPAHHFGYNSTTFVTNVMNASKSQSIPSGNYQVFSQAELNLLAHSSQSDANYKYNEWGGPWSRKVTVYKNGKAVYTSPPRSHFKDARKNADTFVEADKKRDEKILESLRRLNDLINGNPNNAPQSGTQPPPKPPKLKIPNYGTREDKRNHRVEVIGEDGKPVASFHGKHTSEARDKANNWAKNDIQKRTENHNAEMQKYEKEMAQYNRQLVNQRRINSIKTGVSSAFANACMDNYEYLMDGEFKTFGKKVTRQTTKGGLVTVAVTGISEVVPVYSTGCSVVRSIRDGRVKAANGEGFAKSVLNPGVKIVANVAVPVLCATAIASNPVLAGVALAVYARGVNKTVDKLI